MIRLFGHRMEVVTGATGRWLLLKLLRALDYATFLWVCVLAFIRFRDAGRRLIRRILVEQIYFTAVQSLELVTIVAVVTGALFIVIGIDQLARLGNLESLSALLIAMLIREVGPLTTAIIIILRSGSAIAIEIGYMNVLGEIEGLTMQGIPAFHFLCVPRLIGAIVSMVCLIILFDMIAVAGGMFAAWSIMDISAWNYLDDLASTLHQSDFIVVLLKGLCFGLVIPVVCLHSGFQAESAITSIPPRVSRALVDCLLYCLFLNIIISVSFSF